MLFICNVNYIFIKEWTTKSEYSLLRRRFIPKYMRLVIPFVFKSIPLFHIRPLHDINSKNLEMNLNILCIHWYFYNFRLITFFFLFGFFSSIILNSTVIFKNHILDTNLNRAFVASVDSGRSCSVLVYVFSFDGLGRGLYFGLAVYFQLVSLSKQELATIVSLSDFAELSMLSEWAILSLLERTEHLSELPD